jgi:hypothetical protein
MQIILQIIQMEIMHTIRLIVITGNIIINFVDNLRLAQIGIDRFMIFYYLT